MPVAQDSRDRLGDQTRGGEVELAVELQDRGPGAVASFDVQTVRGCHGPNGITPRLGEERLCTITTIPRPATCCAMSPSTTWRRTSSPWRLSAAAVGSGSTWSTS